MNKPQVQNKLTKKLKYKYDEGETFVWILLFGTLVPLVRRDYGRFLLFSIISLIIYSISAALFFYISLNQSTSNGMPWVISLGVVAIYKFVFAGIYNNMYENDLYHDGYR